MVHIIYPFHPNTLVEIFESKSKGYRFNSFHWITKWSKSQWPSTYRLCFWLEFAPFSIEIKFKAKQKKGRQTNYHLELRAVLLTMNLTNLMWNESSGENDQTIDNTIENIISNKYRYRSNYFDSKSNWSILTSFVKWISNGLIWFLCCLKYPLLLILL